MRIEANGLLVLATMLAPGGVLLYTAARLPQWLVGSLGRHAMWRMRDEVMHDVIVGTLPKGEPCVQELASRVDWAVSEARSLDLLHTRVWARERQHIPAEVLRQYAVPDVETISDPDLAQLIDGYRQRYNNIALKTILLSSWVGIFLGFRYFVAALFKVTAEHLSLNAAVGIATRKVVTETATGREARQMVDEKGPESYALAA